MKFHLKSPDAPMAPLIESPLPLISPRIEFRLFSSRPLPSITPRMNCDDLLLDPEQQGGAGPGAADGTRGAGLQGVAVPSQIVEPQGGGHNTEQEGGGTHRDASFADELETPAKYKVPLGQPSRPNSGGYNLENKLTMECGWTKEQLKSVQVSIASLQQK